MVEISTYREGDRAGVMHLMQAPDFKSRIWHWQFEENPFGYAFEPVILRDGDRIVGFNGIMPVDVRYNNQNIRVDWSCDFYVDKSCRGQGLGRVIKTELIGRSGIVMSFGISSLASPVLLKMGWHSSDEVFIFRRYRTARTVRQLLAKLLQHFNWVRGLLKRGIDRDLRADLAGQLPQKAEVDGLWERVCQGYRKIVVRNHSYLHWRYERHPLGQYRYITVYSQNELVAIGVVREDGGTAGLVDLLAGADDRDARNAIVECFLDSCQASHCYDCASSDRLLAESLRAYGFFRDPAQPKFYVRPEKPEDTDCEKGWFIMAGDSDGDMLSASRAHDAIKVSRVINHSVFGEMEQAWDTLIGESSASGLFLGWQWQYTWWTTWAAGMGLDLYLLLAHRGDRLVGIAPMYLDRVSLIGCLPVRRLQFIGNAFRKQETVRTEYMEFITHRDFEAGVCDAFLKYLGDCRQWGEFVVCDMQHSSATFRAINSWRRKYGWFVFVRDTDRGTRVQTRGSFADYLSALGRHTRLKLYYRRGYMEGLGDIKLEQATEDTLDEFFDTLNRLHRSRWGDDCFSGKDLQFHLELLGRLAPERQYELSCISHNDNPISVIYNVTVGDVTYNLQSGFNENFDRKLSLGTLHLGLSIEKAFSDSAVNMFDLLAGSGKHEYYKARFHGEDVEFITLQVARTGFLKFIYRLYLLLPIQLKRQGNEVRYVRAEELE